MYKGKPHQPRESNVKCTTRTADVKWTSSFDGGDSQTFTVFALVGQQEVSKSELIQDEGEGKTHSTTIVNLQPSTEYMFYVSAENQHGNTSSEFHHCKTLPDGRMVKKFQYKFQSQLAVHN